MNDKELAHVKDNDTVIVPVTDIYESPNDYTLTLEMPGVSKDNLDITLDNNELEISGKIMEVENKDKDLCYSEYNLYDYYRKFKVGNDIDRNGIEANLENGILTLKLHKSEEVKPKKIQVVAG